MNTRGKMITMYVCGILSTGWRYEGWWVVPRATLCGGFMYVFFRWIERSEKV